MVVTGRNIRQSQQEIRRDLKVVGNSNKILAGQLASLTANIIRMTDGAAETLTVPDGRT